MAEAHRAGVVISTSGAGLTPPWQAFSPTQPQQVTQSQFLAPSWHQEKPRKRSSLLQELGVSAIARALAEQKESYRGWLLGSPEEEEEREEEAPSRLLHTQPRAECWGLGTAACTCHPVSWSTRNRGEEPSPA